MRKAIATGRFEKCRQYMTVAGELCVIGQLVLRGTRIIIPSKLQPRTLALAHEGHLGVVGTKQNLRTKVWWPGMDKVTERHCRACHGCQLCCAITLPTNHTRIDCWARRRLKRHQSHQGIGDPRGQGD